MFKPSVMVDIEIVERAEQQTACVRESVPMDAVSAFFARAFHDTLATMQAQGIQPTGAPFAKYYGVPTTVVDVEAGFPVAHKITPGGGIMAGTLPRGRVVEATHIGPYENLHQTYAEMARYFETAGLTPGAVMWESYLSDPEREPDSATWRTQICWPVDNNLAERSPNIRPATGFDTEPSPKRSPR